MRLEYVDPAGFVLFAQSAADPISWGRIGFDRGLESLEASRVS